MKQEISNSDKATSTFPKERFYNEKGRFRLSIHKELAFLEQFRSQSDKVVYSGLEKLNTMTFLNRKILKR